MILLTPTVAADPGRFNPVGVSLSFQQFLSTEGYKKMEPEIYYRVIEDREGFAIQRLDQMTGYTPILCAYAKTLPIAEQIVAALNNWEMGA